MVSTRERFRDVNRKKESTLKLWERAVRYFTSKGAIEESRGSFIVLIPKDEQDKRKAERKYFIGKSGAIRVGRGISNSRSVTDFWWPQIEEWEKVQGFRGDEIENTN